MTATVVASPADLVPLVGTELGTSDGIHVDPERAAEGPFATIAHGFLTPALVMPLRTDPLEVTSVVTKVNYRVNKVRFPAPVPGGAQLTVDASMECEASAKPVCVAQLVHRFYE